MRLELDDLRDAFGLGVAGNFAGHLEQAGEAGDFASVEAPDQAPKGIFPWYVPGHDGFLGTFPLAADRLCKPAAPAGVDAPVNLQIEPEVGIVCAVDYDDSGVVALRPRLLGAFNDCSIRREGAAKISHKKNWGAASKGLASTVLTIDDLEPGGPTAALRLVSFLRRDGVTHAYGTDSPLPDYSYYGARLLDWIAERLGHQPGTPGTPLEDVGALIDSAGRPATVVVAIGSTRYTPFGASTYLDLGDTSLVIVYDGAASSPGDVARAVAEGREDELPAASVLRQDVEAGPPAPDLD